VRDTIESRARRMIDEFGDDAALESLKLAREAEYRFEESQFWVDVAVAIVRGKMSLVSTLVDR
jgi:hypothetical protein